ncbi:MAG: hypothetical protein IJB21_00960 [Bacilli bacterium]|nr:hypothetical protein [Bacilli bacterium]
MIGNKPVYEFLGYKLLKVNFHRYNDEKLSKFSFKIINRNYNNEDNVYSFCVSVNLDFKDNEESNFIFLTAFLINDIKWYSSLENNIRDSMFFSIVFPFIRQKINEFCDDSRELVRLPIVNLKNICLDQEVVLSYINND